MIDERKFITKVESASSDQFAEIIRTANIEEQQALGAYFGPERLQRLRTLAQAQLTRGPAQKLGKVVILPGILGSELSTTEEKVWFRIWSIFKGDFDQLQVNRSGASVKTVSPTGVLRMYYGETELYLSRNWDVLTFPFDWRLSIRESADALAVAILKRFGSAKDVHIVAHSMGGLVARSLAQRQNNLWKTMGRLVMLGTPNYGSCAIIQLYTGLYRLIRVVAAVDQQHQLPELLQFAKMFVGTYHMLPRSDKLQNTAGPQKVFDPATYGSLQPLAARFDDARKFQRELDAVLDPERMTYIAGDNRKTADGIVDWTQIDNAEGYGTTLRGDGTVAHALGVIPNVRTYYVDEEHSELPSNQDVLDAVDGILQGMPVTTAREQPVVARRAEDSHALAVAKQREDDAAVEQARQLALRLRSARGAYDSIAISPEEQQITDLAFTDRTVNVPQEVGGTRPGPAASHAVTAGLADQATPADDHDTAAPKELPELAVHVLWGDIEKAGEGDRVAGQEETVPGIDAVAVGHYIGVLPVYAELALDKAISAPLLGLHATADSGTEPQSETGATLVSQFTQRGIVRGDLGRPFFLPDPRNPNRLIVIAGMGPAGRFGAPELTVLAREMFWSLALLGRRHLASVLIGSGSGNLEIPVAARSWLRGAALAIANRINEPRIEALTFVERDARKAEELRLTLGSMGTYMESIGLRIDVTPKAPIPQPAAPTAGPTGKADGHDERRHAPTRILVELQGDYYRFSAVTDSASFPERAVRLNPRIVSEINNVLASPVPLETKREWGEFLFKLLVPQDVQSALTTNAPIVLACDSNVAQIHWELMAMPDLSRSSLGLEESFLGLYPGVTRQLRNNFAGPPEPPPPSGRILRVLIVADTVDESRLPGAAEEAEAVRKLFMDYDQQLLRSGSRRRVQVDALIGPEQASCAQVLKRLMQYPPYDILHYSGHCDFDNDDPSNSGWFFSKGMKLSANELSRVDRIPAFVFSNACQSGVTPSRPDLRAPALAPSFAESFFDRGVKNFVCTAWPVFDDAAQKFACRFYKALLGFDDGKPAFVHEAMRSARGEIWNSGTGVETWGAYQHYGNPWFKLF